MMRQQRTLAKEFTYKGVGLHTGNPVTMKFIPAPPNAGIIFKRVDLDPVVEIEAITDNILSTTDELRNTSLVKGEVTIHTVEHLLASLAGLNIDNCCIELDSNEPAESATGSCQDYVDHFNTAGIEGQGLPVRFYEIKEQVTLIEGDVELSIEPYDGFKISFTIDYDHPHIGCQQASFDINPAIFENELCRARTFVLFKDVEMLRQKGLIKGGSMSNAVVIGDDGIMNEEPLHYDNEFVRHKILDLLGDISLLGMPIRGHLTSKKSGHVSNGNFAKLLAKGAKRQDPTYSSRNVTHWNIRDIMKIMPHRYPFLLIDRLVEMDDGKKVVGLKNVTINEPFFNGHFPDHPIFPAVLILEAMAQTGGMLLLSTVDNPKNKLVYFMGIDKARFRQPVLPGDQMRLELTMLRLKQRGCKMRGEVFVDGNLVAEAELLASVVER